MVPSLGIMTCLQKFYQLLLRVPTQRCWPEYVGLMHISSKVVTSSCACPHGANQLLTYALQGLSACIPRCVVKELGSIPPNIGEPQPMKKGISHYVHFKKQIRGGVFTIPFSENQRFIGVLGLVFVSRELGALARCDAVSQRTLLSCEEPPSHSTEEQGQPHIHKGQNSQALL